MKKEGIYKDKDGHQYKIKKTSTGYQVFLKNKGTRKWKHIADIEKGKWIKNFDNTHIFTKMKTIGFPYYLISRLITINAISEIEIRLPGKTLVAPVEVIGEGKFLHYKKKGYELQIHIPIEKFKEKGE
jgi:hypothetical protein